MTRLLISLIMTVVPLATLATDNETNRFRFIGVRSHYGFIIPHAEKIRSISYSNPRSLELDIGAHFAGERAWRHCFCYPRTGMMFTWTSFNNPEILGNGYSVVPYVEPFFLAGELFSLSLKTGIGLAYLDNIYDPENNPLNHFYSTHISFLLFMNLNMNYRLNDRVNLRAGAYYNHISNGGNRQPNKGINFPTASIGFDWFLVSPVFPERKREDYLPAERRRHAVRLSVFGTSKEVSKDDRREFPVYGVSPKFSYLVGRVSAGSAGFEYVYDGTLRERARQGERSGADHRRFSFFMGHELLIGKINFYQEMGVYLYAPFRARDNFYQRYGIEYSIFNNISAGLSFKAHRHVADFLDFRVTYMF